MENIPSSFMGYKKSAVNDIINQKDTKLSQQQGDIDYLRNQVSTLEKTIKEKEKKH